MDEGAIAQDSLFMKLEKLMKLERLKSPNSDPCSA
jgi:hypothetical protein